MLKITIHTARLMCRSCERVTPHVPTTTEGRYECFAGALDDACPVTCGVTRSLAETDRQAYGMLFEALARYRRTGFVCAQLHVLALCQDLGISYPEALALEEETRFLDSVLRAE